MEAHSRPASGRPGNLSLTMPDWRSFNHCERESYENLFLFDPDLGGLFHDGL